MEESIATAASFLTTIGFGEYAPVCVEAQINLVALSSCSLSELQQELGIDHVPTAMALLEECFKLRQCLQRSSPAVELPVWLPQLLPPHRRPEVAGAVARAELPPVLKAGSGLNAARRGGSLVPVNLPIESLDGHDLSLICAGVQPPMPPTPDRPMTPMPPSPRRAMPNAHGMAAADEAKRAVMRAIGAREEAISSLRNLLPEMRNRQRSSLAQATQQLVGSSGEGLAQRRQQLGVLLGTCRRCTVTVCHALLRWKDVLRSHYSYFAVMPEDQTAFYLPDGVNYMEKMGHDLGDALPVPAAQDPLLLEWFEPQLPWLTTRTPQLRQLDIYVDKAFGPPTDEDARKQLDEVQELLLNLGGKGSGGKSASARLARAAAQRRARINTKGSKTGGSTDEYRRWQWSMYQLMLYGGEHYRILVAELPSYHRNRELEAAVVMVQQAYRERRSRMLVKVTLQRKAVAKQERDIKQAADEYRAAMSLQARWRGKQIREALHSAPKVERRKTMVDLQQKKRAYELRKQQQGAARVIQRMALRRLAILERKSLKQEAEFAAERIAAVLAQSASLPGSPVSLFEKVALRHMQAGRTLARVYNEVTTAYEHRDRGISGPLRTSTAVSKATMLNVSGATMRLEAIQEEALLRISRIAALAPEAFTHEWASFHPEDLPSTRNRRDSMGRPQSSPGTRKRSSPAAISRRATASGFVSDVSGLPPSNSRRPSTAQRRIASSAQQAIGAGVGMPSEGSAKSTGTEAAMQDASGGNLSFLELIQMSNAAERDVREAGVAEAVAAAHVQAWRNVIDADGRPVDMKTVEEVEQQMEVASKKRDDARLLVRDAEASATTIEAAMNSTDLVSWSQALRVAPPGASPTPRADVAAAATAAVVREKQPLRAQSSQARPKASSPPVVRLAVSHLRCIVMGASQVAQESKGWEAATRRLAMGEEQVWWRCVEALDAHAKTVTAKEEEAAEAQRQLALHKTTVGVLGVVLRRSKDAFDKPGDAEEAAALAAEEELAEARQRRLRVDRRAAALRTPFETFLVAEGGLRVLSTLDQRARTKAGLKVQRMEAYRGLCAVTATAKLKAKKAEAELLGVEAAECVAKEVVKTPVQVRDYREGSVSFMVVDKRTSAAKERDPFVSATEEERADLAEKVSDYLEQARDDRVYIASWERVDGETPCNGGRVGDDVETPTRRATLGGTLAAPPEGGLARGRSNTMMGSPSTPEGGAARGRSRTIMGSPSTSSPKLGLGGIEVTLKVRREEGEELKADELVRRIAQMHEDGTFTPLLGISRDRVKALVTKMPTETVVDAPSLQQRLDEATASWQAIADELGEVVERKSHHKKQVRVWHRLKGAFEHVLKVDVHHVVHTAEEEAEQEANGCPHRWSRRWAGVQDVGRSQVAHIAAGKDKERRKLLKKEAARQKGVIDLVTMLMTSCEEWPQVLVPAGKAKGESRQYVDRRWNTGLPPRPVVASVDPEDEDDLTLQFNTHERATFPNARSTSAKEVSQAKEADSTGSAMETPVEGHGDGRYCYFCATLANPLRARHRFSECPKRRRACAKEYTEEKMAEALAKLSETRAACEATLDAHAASVVAAATNKKHLLEVNGAIRVVQRQERHRVSAPPPPPDAPRCERRIQLHVIQRQRLFDVRRVLRLLSRVGTHENSWWGRLKVVALLRPEASRVPITPGWVHRVAASLGADLASKNSQALLPVVLSLARAPPPAGWHQIPAATDEEAERNGADYENPHTGERCVGHPAAHVLREMVQGRQRRAKVVQQRKPADGWVQFASGGSSFYYNFSHGSGGASDELNGETTTEFPQVLLQTRAQASSFPPRRPEPSAAAIEAIGRDGPWAPAGLSGDALVRAAKDHVLAPVLAKRVRSLAHQPCPADELFLLGHYLGVDALEFPELMWLAEAAMSADLPLGWLWHEPPDDRTRGYFFNAALGVAQWEHPQHSYIAGVAARLVESLRMIKRDKEAVQAQQRKLKRQLQRGTTLASVAQVNHKLDRGNMLTFEEARRLKAGVEDPKASYPTGLGASPRGPSECTSQTLSIA